GGNPPRRSVGLFKVTRFFQIGHYVAHRCRRQPFLRQSGDDPRADRLPRRDMGLNKERQHFATALVQNVSTLSHPPQSCSETGKQAEPKRVLINAKPMDSVKT